MLSSNRRSVGGLKTPLASGSGGVGRTILYFMSYFTYSSDSWNELLSFKNQQVEALQRKVLELQSKLNYYEQLSSVNPHSETSKDSN